MLGNEKGTGTDLFVQCNKSAQNGALLYSKRIKAVAVPILFYAEWRVDLERRIDPLRKNKGLRAVW